LEEIDADVTAHRQSAGPLGVGPPFAFVCFATDIDYEAHHAAALALVGWYLMLPPLPNSYLWDLLTASVTPQK